MGRPLSALVLAALLLLSPIAGAGGAVAAGPGGMVTVASDQVTSNVPQHAQDRIPTSAQAWQPQASSHAEDLQVEITTESVVKGKANSPNFDKSTDDLVMRFTDDVNHEGRTVAVDASTLEDTVGYRPTFAYGRHEDGSTWKRPISYSDGVASWEIPHFSTNDVTFDGDFSLKATPAADGDSFSWNTSDGGENLVINVTGHTNTESDNVTKTGISPSSTHSISVGGNMPPTDGAGGDPKLQVRVPLASDNPFSEVGDGSSVGAKRIMGDTGNDNEVDGEVRFVPEENYTVSNLLLNLSSTGSDYGFTVDIYIVQETPDTTTAEGTLVKSGWDPSFSDGERQVNIDSYSVEKGKNYTVEFDVSGTDTDGTADTLDITTDGAPSETWISDGLYTYSSAADLTARNNSDVNNLEVSDGAGETVTIGSLSAGSSATKRINLSTSSSELNFSGSGGNISADLTLYERTQSSDLVVELNGNSESYTGTLSDGQTVTITTNDSHLVAGENVLNVSVGDGTLSSDAPTPQVDLNVTHDVVTTKSIDFQAESFSERYNASKTWESNTSNAQMSVTWASSRVVKVRNVSVKYKDDTGSTFKTDSSPTYTLENGTVTVQLGDVQAGTTTEVHLDGSKVQVQNGSIKVLKATPAGHKLDTKIEITNQTTGFGISLGGTATGEFTHYTTDESYSSPSTFVEEHANGKQVLRAPSAPDAATMRIKYVPLEVDPKSGAVEVEIVDPATPKFRIRKGNLAGSDEVHLRYHEVVTGETWRLYSVTAGEEVMRDEAESPVELITDDSSETYILELVTSSSTTKCEPPNCPAPATTTASSPVSLVVLIGAVIATIVGLMVIGRRYFGATGLRDNTVLLVGGTIVGLVAVEYIGAGSLFGWMASVIGTAAGGFAASTAGTVAGAVAMLIGLYLVNTRLVALPNWLWIISAGAIGVWVIDEVTGGALSAGLSEVSPLLWLAAAGAVIVVIWRFVGPRPVKVVGGGS